jgi:hypothetical protein
MKRYMNKLISVYRRFKHLSLRYMNKLISVYRGYKRLSFWDKVFFWGAVAGIISLCLMILRPFPRNFGDEGMLSLQKQSGEAGEWLSDKYVGVRIPNTVRGMLLADEPYSVDIEIRNQTSNVLYIPEIVVRHFNDAYSRSHESVFEGIIHLTLHLNPHQIDTVTYTGNRILPERVSVSIAQNLSNDPSKFEVDVGGEVISPLGSRQLPPDAVSAGFDGLSAIKKALEYSRDWLTNAHVFVVHPLNSSGYLDRETRLKFIKVDTWRVSLINEMNIIHDFHVSEQSITELGRFESSIEFRPVPIPRIGNQEALRLMNDKNIICSDWRDVKLIGGKKEGEWTCAWHLPYLDCNSEPIIVDAISGERVSMEILRGKSSMLEDLPIYSAYHPQKND